MAVINDRGRDVSTIDQHLTRATVAQSPRQTAVIRRPESRRERKIQVGCLRGRSSPSGDFATRSSSGSPCKLRADLDDLTAILLAIGLACLFVAALRMYGGGSGPALA